MLKNFITVISKGILEYVRPTQLVERTVAALKLVARAAAGAEYGLKVGKDRNNAFRSSYNTVSIPLSSIHKASCVAGVDICNTSSVAGKTLSDKYKYFTAALPANLIALGKSPDDVLLLCNQDFVRHGNGYLFRKDPAAYGTVTRASSDDGVYVSFYWLGGSITAKHRTITKNLYGNTGNNVVFSAIRRSVTTGALCAGLSNAPIAAASSAASVFVKKSRIKQDWIENGYRYLYTDTGLVRCSTDTRIIIEEEEDKRDGGIVGTVKIDSTDIIVPCNNSIYYIDTRMLDPRNIPSDIINVYALDAGTPDKMYDVLRDKLITAGVVTIDVTHGSRNLSPGEVSALNRRTPITSSLRLVSKVIANVPMSVIHCADVDEVLVHYTNNTEITDADVKYEFELSGDARWLHQVTSKNSGMFVCKSLAKSNNVICATTDGSAALGAQPMATSKIYGISIISSGKSESDDVVYSYIPVKPTMLGIGVSAGIVVVRL